MTVTLDITDDFVDVVDNLEAVEVRPPQDENSNSELLTNGRFDEGLSSWSAAGAAWEERLALCTSSSEYLGQAATTVADTVYVLSLDVFATWLSTAPIIKVGTSLGSASIVNQSVSESGRLEIQFTASGAETWVTLTNGDRTARFGNVSLKALSETDVSNALRRAVSNREAAASGGKYRQGDTKWHLSQLQQTTEPKLGGVIEDTDGTLWTILAVDNETLSHRWRCWCRKHSVADVTLGTIVVRKCAYPRDASGAVSVAPRDWAHAVKARIQPQATTRTVEHGQVHTPERVTVYLKHNYPLDARFQFVGADGKVFKFVGSSDPARIDNLYAVEAEAVPWPLN